MTQYETDADIMRRISNGGVLTALDITRLTDDSTSDDNVVKKAYRELEQDIELHKYIEDKIELQAAMRVLLNSLLADSEWRERLKVEQKYQNAIQKENELIENKEDRILSREPTNYLQELLGLGFPELSRNTLDGIQKYLFPANKSDHKLEPEAFKDVMHLCEKHLELRDYITKKPEKNSEHDVQQICHQILYISAMLKHTAINDILQDLCTTKEKEHRHQPGHSRS